jgi:WD40 repeat protein
MDVKGELAVVGSADHGLKVFDTRTCKEKRNLFSKKFGHTEWVTGCKFLTDGRIVSGGMDSKLCLWHSTALRCDDLPGHIGSISEIDVNDQNIAVSASYDRTLRIWNLDAKQCMATLSGHREPVTHFAWCGSLVMSGDRKGVVKIWDCHRGECIGTHDSKVGAQTGALGHVLSEAMGHLSFVGDQSGVLTVFDLTRTGTTPVFREVLHPGGVISSAKGMGHRDMLVTAGADKKILCLDLRMDLSKVHIFSDHRDYIYSLELLGPLIVSGAGNGWVLVHDVDSGQCCYGLGANAAAVRTIFADKSRLVCAGDDGKAAVYDFSP